MNSSLIKAFVWATLIMIGCGISGNTLQQWHLPTFIGFDKIVHFLWFFALFLFLAKGLLLRDMKQNNAFFLAATIAISYGLLLELMQFYIFEKRSAEWADFIADTGGTIIAVMLFSQFKKIRFVYKLI